MNNQMDTISADMLKIATQIRERANSHRTAIVPDGYGGYEERDIGPSEWLLGIAAHIETLGQEQAKMDKTVEDLLDIHKQVALKMQNLVRESKSEEQEETPATDKPSGEPKRKQAIIVRYSTCPDVFICQDEETYVDPFQRERDTFGSTVPLDSYKKALTCHGYEWCEIMHLGRDHNTTLICDATPGYKFHHSYEGMKVGDIKDWTK